MQYIDNDFSDNGTKILDKLSAFFWLENFAKMNLVLRIWSHILKKSIIKNFILVQSLQTHHVDSTFKRFHVVSMWNPRGVFVGV